MEGPRFAVALGLVVVAAFGGRAAYIMVETRDQRPPPPLQLVRDPTNAPPDLGVRQGFDELFYFYAAIKVGDGHGFKTPFFYKEEREEAVHPPMTVLVLAPVARFSNGSDLAMRFTMAIAGAGTVLLIGLIARGIAGNRAALIAAALAAVYPNLWMHDGLIMSESLSALTTAATVYCTYRLVRSPTWRRAIAVGVVCGLAVLTRSELALFVPVLVLPAIFTTRALGRRQQFRLFGVVVLASALTVTPWIAYNMARFQRPVFISYGDASTLLGANCDPTYSGPLVGYWDGYCAIVPAPGEPSVDAVAQRREALDYIRDHLDQVPRVMAIRVARVWNLYRPIEMLTWYQHEGKPKWASLPGLGMYWLLVAFGVLGAVTLRRRGVALIPLVAPVVMVTIVAAAFYGLLRNRVPAEVSFVVLAAVALDALTARADSSSATTSPVPSTPTTSP